MRLRNVLIVLGTGVLAALMSLMIAVVPARAATDPQAAEAAFVDRINALRSSSGLPTLRVDGELTAIARRWAAHMAEQGQIAHNPSFSSWVTANWVKLGENVGTGPDVDSLHDAFVASPTHYKNLVDGDFHLIGIGVVVTADGTLYTAHQFERLADAPVAAPAPAAAPAVPPTPAHALQVLETLRTFDRPAA